MKLKAIPGWLSCVLLLAAGALVVGCSGPEPEDSTYDEEETSGDEASREPNDGSSITGLMGTIRPDQVENALNPRMGRFERCFGNRMGTVELLGGNIRMSFRIHTDGSVAWVFPSETDIGDRETEQCILEVARGTRFPPPRGGEAEFSWGFGFDIAEDLRPPLNWEAGALGNRADDLPGLARECRVRGDYSITAYVQPGGAILAAGGAPPDAEGEEVLDCVLGRVREWSLPDPGSYPAKITFAVR